MQQTFTKKYAKENCGCYSHSKLSACSFTRTEEITLESILKSEIPLKHKFWFVCKKLASVSENQYIAIGVAEIVLPIYEARYKNNKAPRKAIEAAKLFISGKISYEELAIARRAAYAAADAAAYVAAADAAAYVAAADAAAYVAAADAAAYADADAAAYVADAAAAAYAAAAAAAYVAAADAAAYVADAAAAAYAAAAAAAYAAADAAYAESKLLNFLIDFSCLTNQ